MAFSKIKADATELDLATQVEIDAKLATTVATSTYAPIASPTFTGTVAGVTKAHVGLSNVDNTTDALKPVSTATAASITTLETASASIRQDITILALREAVTENRVAYNLPNSFIDQFQDDSGIGTETAVDRDETSEFMSAGYYRPALLLYMDGANNGTSFPDSSYYNHTITVGGNVHTDTGSGLRKFGTAAAEFDGTGDCLHIPTNTVFDFGTGDFTVECWIYQLGSANYDGIITFQGSASSSSVGFGLGYNANNRLGWLNSLGSVTTVVVHDAALSDSVWHHIAVSRSSGVTKLFINGAEEDSAADTFDYQNISLSSSQDVTIGRYYPTVDDKYFYGRIDEIRILKGKAAYTAPFTPIALTLLNEAGTLIGNANVPSSAQTKVSGVMLYKDATGTATLGTDIIVSFTCNGGTNWTDLVLADMTAVTPVFSTGIKMVKLAEKTCTSGSDIRYKVVWANQSDGVKETQLHGIGLNY